MLEIQEEDIPQVENKKQEVLPSESENAPHTTSHESFLGAILFFCMILFVIASIASIGWFSYKSWQDHNNTLNEPSIAQLSEEKIAENAVTETKDEETAKSKEESKPEEKDTPVDQVSLRKTAMSVLNGGGARGSAGTLATFLKGEGYTNVTAGNTIKDYTGATLYFASGMENEADAIKLVLIKQYPQIKALVADATNKETSVSKITIIIGK